MVKTEKLIGRDFNTKPTYGHHDKYVKTKKIFEGNITTNSYNKKGSKKLPEEKIPPKCLSIIILDSILAYEKYHPQTFLEECKRCERKYKN